MLSGVLTAGNVAENLWFLAREGRVYTLRVWASEATASVHHPTWDGTSRDDLALFSMSGSPGAAMPSTVSFEAPLTGWYRVHLVAPPPGEFGAPFPRAYTLQLGEGPARMPDYSEILSWAGGSASCAP